MKKILIAIAALILEVPTGLFAQNNEPTSITVKDAQGRDEQIDLPESMTADIDSLMNDYIHKTYLKPSSDCNMPDINPVYEKEVYKERLAKLPTVIEMPYNDVVQSFIDRYSGKLRHSVAFWLGAQNFYMPIFETALETYGLPLELKYLPVIESGLNPQAVSRVGATGLWQFMITTGKRYGLEVNSLVDERRDPVKASYAAAHYLRDLYTIFGDWNLVVAAYNCGPDKINHAIHRAKGEKDYWKIYPYLPRETRGYVPAFIAANYIMNYYCDHNICPLVTDLPVKTDTVMVTRDVHFEQVAHVLGMTVDQLKSLNPQYRHNVINGAAHASTLRLPTTMINTFIDREDSIYAYNADELLSKRKEVEVSQQAEVSDSKSSKSSSRRSSKASSRKKKSRRSSKKRASKSVTIREGDTLSEIAERHHTTVKKLKKLNGISGSSIRAGKKIKVK